MSWIEFKTPEEYLEFFSAIPEEKWCVFDFKAGAQMCAIGHLTGGEPDDLDHHPFRRMVAVSETDDAATINNGWAPFDALGSTPKERIVNALILKCAGLWEEACQTFNRDTY